MSVEKIYLLVALIVGVLIFLGVAAWGINKLKKEESESDSILAVISREEREMIEEYRQKKSGR